jgi:phosphoglycolate phosphatase-like HAD superfamily hydrolase
VKRSGGNGTYLIWDWNGTLFDDRSLLFESIASTLQAQGYGEWSPNQIAATFTRPLRALFEGVVGRPLSSQEWAVLESAFHAVYRGRLAQGALVPKAREALISGRAHAEGQAMVSQWSHDDLVKTVERHALNVMFDEIWGRSEQYQNKADRIGELLHRNRLRPDRVVLIGDARDDIAAAAAAGIKSVLVVGASLEQIDPSDVAALHIPVAHCLTDAVELALQLVGPPGQLSTADSEEVLA